MLAQQALVALAHPAEVGLQDQDGLAAARQLRLQQRHVLLGRLPGRPQLAVLGLQLPQLGPHGLQGVLLAADVLEHARQV